MVNLDDIIVTEVINTITVKWEKGEYIPKIHRKNYGLSFCIDGQITYNHKNVQFVCDKNHAVILPQDQIYSIYGDNGGFFPLINFKTTSNISDTIISIPINNSNAYIHDYEQLSTTLITNKSKTKALGYLYKIIARLHIDSKNIPTILKEIINFIENNYTDPLLTNLTIAHNFGISEVYLRKLFAKYYNTTPKQYIINLRLSLAAKLLTEGFLKVGAIAEKCGFSSFYHFCYTFKKNYGQTPSEFMNEHEF